MGRILILLDVIKLVLARFRRAVSGLPERRALSSGNNLFSQQLLGSLAREKARLEMFDLYLFRTLNSRWLKGQIVFEYGTLLNHVRRWEGLRVLDVGAGRSSLPRWMAREGAAVVAFEYPDQVEKPTIGWRGRINDWIQRRSPEPELAYGTMLDMPLPDKSFDLVCSFSVIEHLDTNLPDLRYVPYPEQKRRAIQTLREMFRVTRPGGLIYLTSECYQPRFATEDSWQEHYYFRDGPDRDLKEPKFSSAWPVDEITEIFHETLIELGCELIGGNALDPAHLDGNPVYASFRGPHFSGFSVLAQRKAE